MKVMLVNGSPHKSGCTNRALEEVARTLEENGVGAKIFWIGNKPIQGCIGCHKCDRLGHCVFDDVVNSFLEEAGDYDGFVFGDPVHWGAMSGSMTSFMDRAFYANANGGGRRFEFKPAAAVVSARRAGTVSTWDQINRYFALCQMPVVNSRYWNIVHGAKAEEVEEDAEGLQTMRILARNMAYLLKCLEAGRKAGIPLPEKEQTVFTNFIRKHD